MHKMDLNIIELEEVVNVLVGKFDFDIEDVAKFFACSFSCEKTYEFSWYCPLKKDNKCYGSMICVDNFKHFIMTIIDKNKERLC